MAKRPKKKANSRKKIEKNKALNKKKEKLQTEDGVLIKTKAEWVKRAMVNKSEYEKKYKKSIKNNDEFWKKEGKRITWIKPYKKIKNVK